MDELTAKDIPGAILNEPLEAATVHSLKWWLLCRGIQCPSSWKKAQLIECVRKTKSAGTKVVDVDGSYLYRKKVSAGSDIDSDTVALPDIPLTGWDLISGAQSKNVDKIPTVTHGLLYTYLADCVGKRDKGGAFRALQRGFAHWSSGRLSKLEVNTCHPLFCHVKCQMTPSMKQGSYKVYLLLRHEGKLAAISKATCECAAGLSASCTHVSALLHALCALASPTSDHGSTVLTSDEEETALPITSYLCQWKAPQKRKESNLPVSEAVFQKHVYGRQRKHELKPLENFDPRPADLRGTANDSLKSFLTKVRGQSLGVSLLFDESCRCWSSTADKALAPVLPSKEAIISRVTEFKKSLCMPANKLREIEQSTRDQRKSSLWHTVRQYRLTASLFGSVYKRKPTTPPQALVLQILSGKQFTSEATDWGNNNEPIALEKYKEVQEESGHAGLYYCRSGFVICEKYPFLGASPDGVVHDPSVSNPFGLVEIKCPYSYRKSTPFEAGEMTDFCSTVVDNLDGTKQLKLKHSHVYFCQIQGQMAITERKWCDFVIYTERGINIERIEYDSDFWDNSLLPKLIRFYDNCLAPEIVCPVHVLGLPVRNMADT